MAFELNDLFSVPQDSSCCMQQPGWMCDFYFGHGSDVIEEDALNEKCCIQVLRILITKANNEIDELEKDLVFLQSELAWAEYDDWPEICCNALRKKFDCLCVKVRNLKNKDEDGIDVNWLTPRKPAEKLHEIVKALLRDYLQEKDKQLLHVAFLDSSDPPGHAAEVLEESKKFNSCDSYVIVKDEIRESSTTPTENGVIIDTSLFLQEKKTNHSKTVKLRNGNVKDFSPHSLNLEDGHCCNKKVLSSFDLKSAGMEEAKELGLSCNKRVAQNLCLKSADKGRNNLDVVKFQPPGIKFKYSPRNALKHAASYSNKKKSLRTSDTTISEGVEENSSTLGADVIVFASSLKPMEKRKNLGETIKPVHAVKDTDSNACRHETGLDNRMTTVRKSDLEVCRNEEVRAYHTTTSGIEILESYSIPEGKGSPPKADKPANAMLQNICNDALSNSNGLRGRRNNSDSMLASSVQLECGNSDIILDALEHTYGLSGSRNNSDSGLAVSRVEKGGNPAASPDALQHTTDPSERRSNSDSVLAPSRQFKVGNCDISDILRHTSGLNQRRNHSDSILGTFRQAKGRYCDFDKKLCDFVTKAVRKQCIKESNFTMTDNIDSSYSSSEVKGKRKPSQEIVKLEKADPTDTEHSTFTSLFELQDEKGKDTTKTEPDEQSDEIRMDQNATDIEKFNLGLSVKPQKQKVKRKTKSSPLNVQESELVSRSSLISKSKRQWKSGLPSDSSGSNQCLDKEIMKKIVRHHQCEAEEPSVDLDDSKLLISESQKKRKKNSTLPTLVEIKGSTLETDLSIPQSHLIDSAGKVDFSITKSNSTDSCTEAVSSSPFLTSKLENMKVGDLRTIAKEQKLKRYSKLRKSVLIDRITKHLGYS